MKRFILDLTQCEPVGWMNSTSLRLIPIQHGSHQKEFDVIEGALEPEDVEIIRESSRLLAKARGKPTPDENMPTGFNLVEIPDAGCIRVESQ